MLSSQRLWPTSWSRCVAFIASPFVCFRVWDHHRDVVPTGSLDADASSTVRRACCMNASSSITGTPSSVALSSLLPAPGPATTCVVFADTDPATFAPSACSRAFASSRVNCSSVPVSTHVCPTSGACCGALLRSGQCTPSSRQPLDDFEVVRLLEKLVDPFRNDRADIVDTQQFLQRSRSSAGRDRRNGAPDSARSLRRPRESRAHR